MVAYNFQAQFAEAVATGRKRQTIRPPRNGTRHARPGDRLQLYTGMRTKSCHKLIDPDPVCTLAAPIEITSDFVKLESQGFVDNPDHFARCDGFADFHTMLAWFKETHGLPFSGVLIRWDLD